MPNSKLRLSLLSITLSTSFYTFANTNDEQAIERQMTSIWEQPKTASYTFENPFEVSLFDAKHGEDKDRLWSQTKSVFGYGLGVIGVIALMPEDISNWDKDGEVLSKWGDNVTQAPVWDRDVPWINLLGHPYFGGVYYQVARKSGYRQWDSFIYSVMMSTFYWEYGVEAFAERPSIQDLVVTPVLGWVWGEWAFQTEQEIRSTGGQVMGQDWLGSTALFLLDPVDSLGRGINNLFNRDIVRTGSGFISVNEIPVGEGNETETLIRYNIEYKLGTGGLNANQYSKYDYTKVTNDPVEVGVVGFGLGLGHTHLDSGWNMENAPLVNASLGLYPTRSYSFRLNYSRGHADSKLDGEEFTYENYNVSAQRYFSVENNFRPFVSLGFGEEMKDQDRDRKTFVTTFGAGLYYKMNNNWSVEGEWKRFVSTRYNTQDDTIGLNFIYRFSKGEWY